MSQPQPPLQLASAQTPQHLAEDGQPAMPVHKLFATTVALITSQSAAQRPNVMACEWTFNVCWHPLRIMTVIHRDDLTHRNIEASGEFGVNLCSDQQAGLSHLAGSRAGHAYDKLSDPLFEGLIYPGTRIKAPMIRGCVLNAECVVEQTMVIGDYTAFVGRAVTARANPRLRPLSYHQGMYFRLGDRIPKPEPAQSVAG